MVTNRTKHIMGNWYQLIKISNLVGSAQVPDRISDAIDMLYETEYKLQAVINWQRLVDELKNNPDLRYYTDPTLTKDEFGNLIPIQDMDGTVPPLDGDNSGTAEIDMGAYEFGTAQAAHDQFILISVDGLQVSHFNDAVTNGDMPEFDAMIASGVSDTLYIPDPSGMKGHSATSTAPGHAEMLTGFGESVTGVLDNSGSTIPDGLTVFELIDAARSDVAIGAIWGKQKSYIPGPLVANVEKSNGDPAIDEINWWQDPNTWTFTPWQDRGDIPGAQHATSPSVSQKAAEFITAHQNEPFFLFMLWGSTDATAHEKGESSPDYDLALQDVDAGLTELKNTLASLGLDQSAYSCWMRSARRFSKI